MAITSSTQQPTTKISITGVINSSEFQKAKLVLNAAKSSLSNKLSLNVQALTDFEYAEHCFTQHKDHPTLTTQLFPTHYILITHANTKPVPKTLGEVLSFLKTEHNHASTEISAEEVKKEVESHWKTFLAKRVEEEGVSFGYFDVDITELDGSGGAYRGKIIFELYDSISPKLTDNFKQFLNNTKPGPLETTLGYKNTVFSRMVQGGWVQGGEILDPKGKVYEGSVIEDENFIKSHSSRGTLSLVNRGPHSNFSQFMLLFKPIPYFDKKYQVIGKCISGAALLDKMEKVPTTFESPTKKMKVVECGVL